MKNEQPEKLKRLALKFGDNDFYYTCSGLMDILLLKVSLNYQDASNGLPVDKKQLAFIINNLLFGCYPLFQNTFEYNGMERMDEKYISHMRNYLTIDESKILINDEVNELLQTSEWENGEIFYVDFENRQKGFI